MRHIKRLTASDPLPIKAGVIPITSKCTSSPTPGKSPVGFLDGIRYCKIRGFEDV